MAMFAAILSTIAGHVAEAGRVSRAHHLIRLKHHAVSARIIDIETGSARPARRR
jgi:hypothetical protein